MYYPLAFLSLLNNAAGCSTGKIIGPFLTNNLVDGVSVHSNSVNSEDQSDIEGVGVYLNSVSSNS